MAIATINPATGETLKTFEAMTDGEVDDRIARAVSAFERLRATSLDERTRWMHGAADIFESEIETIARTMTTEMGKTLRAAHAEVEKSARACRFYAEHAA